MAPDLPHGLPKNESSSSPQYVRPPKVTVKFPEEQTIPFLAEDPSAALGRVCRPARSNLDAVREKYLHHLGQYRLVAAGYVPNLVPILRWNQLTAPPSAVSTPRLRPQHSPAWTSKGNEQEPDEAVGAPQTVLWPSRCLRAGSVSSSVVNVTAAALGAGALSLPRAMYYAGILWGPVLMLMLAGLSVLSIQVIVRMVELSGKDTYEEIAKRAFGPWFALLVEANIILFCFGTAVAYMITVGDISQQVLQAVLHPGAGSSLTPQSVLPLVTFMILLPLSMMDRINDMRYASFIGVSCILYLIAVVIYVFMSSGVHHSLVDADGFHALEPKGGFGGCFRMLSLAIFAFCCQPNVPAIYTELERKSFRRMDMVSTRAMMLCLVVYLLVGVAGFLAFGEVTNGNVLSNLQPYLLERDWIVISGLACMAFAVTLAFPLNIFPIRFAVETTLFFKYPHLNTRTMRTSIAVAAVGLSLVVAVLIPQINLVFEVIGATTGSFVCFIGPGLLVCRLDQDGIMCSGLKARGCLLIVVGTACLILGTYSSVEDVLVQLATPSG